MPTTYWVNPQPNSMCSTIYTCYPRHMCIPTRYTLPTRYNVSHYIFDVPTTYLLCPQYIHVTNHIKDVLLTVYTDFSTIYISVTLRYMLPTRYIFYPQDIYIYLVGTCSPQHNISCGEHPICSPQHIHFVTHKIYPQDIQVYILWVHLVGNIFISCG